MKNNHKATSGEVVLLVVGLVFVGLALGNMARDYQAWGIGNAAIGFLCMVGAWLLQRRRLAGRPVVWPVWLGAVGLVLVAIVFLVCVFVMAVYWEAVAGPWLAMCWPDFACLR